MKNTRRKKTGSLSFEWSWGEGSANYTWLLLLACLVCLGVTPVKGSIKPSIPYPPHSYARRLTPYQVLFHWVELRVNVWLGLVLKARNALTRSSMIFEKRGIHRLLLSVGLLMSSLMHTATVHEGRIMIFYLVFRESWRMNIYICFHFPLQRILGKHADTDARYELFYSDGEHF